VAGFTISGLGLGERYRVLSSDTLRGQALFSFFFRSSGSYAYGRSWGGNHTGRGVGQSQAQIVGLGFDPRNTWDGRWSDTASHRELWVPDTPFGLDRELMILS